MWTEHMWRGCMCSGWEGEQSCVAQNKSGRMPRQSMQPKPHTPAPSPPCTAHTPHTANHAPHCTHLKHCCQPAHCTACVDMQVHMYPPLSLPPAPCRTCSSGFSASLPSSFHSRPSSKGMGQAVRSASLPISLQAAK
jgi:hypothetical protein